MYMSKYRIIVKKKVEKGLYKLPLQVQKKFFLLARDLSDYGPVQPNWPNYSRLGEVTYHCHLGYSYAACWSYEGNELTIEVYYVGSREDAPY